MKIKSLVEVVWKYYDNGRPSATNRTLREADIRQMVLMETAYQLKMSFFDSRNNQDDNKTDFIGGILSTKIYDLSEPDTLGKRVAVYDDEVMRLPKNIDIPNIKMVGEGCTQPVSGEVTQVQPGEENFYIYNPDLSSFIFYVQKGNKYETYHIPPCVKQIEVERIYTYENIDIPLDISNAVAAKVLDISLGIRGFIPIADNSQDGNRNQIRYKIEQMAAKG